MNFLTIKQVIYDWARNNSGIEEEGRHIWMYQNHSRPASTFVGLNITNGPQKIGNTDSIIYNDISNNYDVTGVRNFNLDVNVYGSDALNIATQLALSLERSDVQEFYRDNNITPYGSKPNVVSYFEKLDTVYEERSIFELTFLASYVISGTNSYIDQVNFNQI